MYDQHNDRVLVKDDLIVIHFFDMKADSTGNKAAGSSTGMNTLKLEQESEELARKFLLFTLHISPYITRFQFTNSLACVWQTKKSTLN